MHYKDSARLLRFETHRQRYYRISFSHGSSWYKYDFPTGNLIAASYERAAELEKEFGLINKPAGLSLEKTREQVLEMVANSVKEGGVFDSKVYQPNNTQGFNFIVNRVEGASCIYVVEPLGTDYRRRGESSSGGHDEVKSLFLFATFTDSKVEFHFSTEIMGPNSRKWYYNNLLGKLGDAFNTSLFNYFYKEVHERICLYPYKLVEIDGRLVRASDKQNRILLSGSGTLTLTVQGLWGSVV